MTADAVSEFVRQNGAFGVLVVLIFLFVWRGIPWVTSRFDQLHKDYGDQLKTITASHEKAMEGVTATLKGIRDDLTRMDTRMIDLEHAVKKAARRDDE